MTFNPRLSPSGRSKRLPSEHFQQALRDFREKQYGRRLGQHELKRRMVRDFGVESCRIGHNTIGKILSRKEIDVRGETYPDIREFGKVLGLNEDELFEKTGDSVFHRGDPRFRPLSNYREGRYHEATAAAFHVVQDIPDEIEAAASQMWEAGYVLNRAGTPGQFIHFLMNYLMPFLDQLVAQPSQLSERLRILITLPVAAFFAERGHARGLAHYAGKVRQRLHKVEQDNFEFDTVVRHVATWPTTVPEGFDFSFHHLLKELSLTPSNRHNRVAILQLKASRFAYEMREVISGSSRKSSEEFDATIDALARSIKASLPVGHIASSSIAPATVFRGLVAIADWSVYREAKIPLFETEEFKIRVEDMIESGCLPEDVFVVESGKVSESSYRWVRTEPLRGLYSELRGLVKERQPHKHFDKVISTVNALADSV